MHNSRFCIDAADWTRSERFDIAAKADGDPDSSQMRMMLQGLLVVVVDRVGRPTAD
jgi:Protein of unknown function (DUF3738).